MKESFALFSTSLFSISATHLYNSSSLYPSWNFILNCSLSSTKLVIYIYKTFNSTSDRSEVDILTFNNLKSASGTICCLLSLYQMLRSNYYKYSEAHTKHKLSLSVEDVVSEVCLIMSTEASWSVWMIVNILNNSTICQTFLTTQTRPAISNSVSQYLISASLNSQLRNKISSTLDFVE